MRIRVIGTGDACDLEQAAHDLAYYLVQVVRAAKGEGRPVRQIEFLFRYVEKGLVKVRAKVHNSFSVKDSEKDDFEDYLIPEGMKEIEHLQFLEHRLGQLALAHGMWLEGSTGNSFSLCRF